MGDIGELAVTHARAVSMTMFSAVALAVACGSALACRFERFELRENIAASEVSFVATVLESGAERGAQLPRVARVRVDAALKGALAAGREVAVESRLGSCGVDLRAGERWVVVARRDRGQLWTSQPAGSVLLTDSRGLHQPAAWDALRRAARPAQLDPLIARDSCVAARTALMDFFDRLPRACRVDADCAADQYIDTQACYPPIVTNRERVPLGQVEALYALQQRERSTCPLDSARVPACGPTVVQVACVAGLCSARR